MTKTVPSDPWRALPPQVVDLIEPELEAITGEILTSIAREVPEYARPLEGSFGRGVRTGVGEALRQFLALVRDPDAGRGQGREVYLALGRGELRQGRTLDSLQAAYRVGARVAWRRIAAACLRGGLDPEALSLLAEAIFAYIDELSADSVEGYAEAQREAEDTRQRRRGELVELLLRAPPPDHAEVQAAARAAAWRLPRRLAAAACRERDLAAVGRRLSTDALLASREGVGCVLVPDPDGPGRAEELGRAAGDGVLALGPAAEPLEARSSWELAAELLRAREAGQVAGEGVLRAEDNLTPLLLRRGGKILARIAERRLAPLGDLTPLARQRMAATALAYVRHGGNAVAMAAELHVHPQTARYRTARLRELFGSELDDPDVRLELHLALWEG